ncbi:MAG: rhodanese-like domain-containing protein [Gemmatimonadetes bacterium]|nr:rhodanese-like domain-containing protein [Gemmatimonadota bacterium]
MIGSLQALETIKTILGIGDTLVGRLLLFHALHLRFRELRLRKDPECPACGEHPTVTGLIDYERFCGLEVEPAFTGPEISAPELAHEIDDRSDVVIIDVRGPHELDICRIEGAIPIPLGELPSRLSVLDGHWNVVTLCHKGVRSLKALEILQSAGFSRVRSLHG